MTSLWKKLWTESAPLTACCILMLAVFVVSAAGIFIDPRIITGAPAWLKPAKFAISTAIFSGSIAWLFQYLTVWPRLKRASGWMLTIILVLEVALIDVQAARGMTSHFNVSTTADSILFEIMGIAIGMLLVISAGIAWALFRQPFANRTWGWSLRLGMLICVLGAACGGIMLGPTAQQRQMLAAHQKPAAIGGHTIGAPDGGEGIPGVGWSMQHGDLRVPHFFGLHALQILPFLGWLVLRGRRGTRLLFTLAASYLAFIAILVWQALRGQSIVEPDTNTLIAFAVWAAATLLGAILAGRRPGMQGKEYDSRTPVLTV
jgi:hypothetical protein